jgi:MYXO-CTERM domain-containing protein
MTERMASRALHRWFLALSTLWVLHCFTALASAHVDLDEPPMRGGDQKTGPCEGGQRGTPMEFEAGSTITVTWSETIDHPGYFLISFDPDGDDFDGDGDGEMDYPASVNGDDEPSGNGDLVLLEVEDTGGADFSAEVTLPNMACDNCTLQLIQNMGERTPMANNPTAHLYFRCADITLVGGDGGGEGGSGGETASGGSPAGGAGGSLDMGGSPSDGGSGGDGMIGMGGMPGPEPDVTVPPAGNAGSGMLPPSNPITPVPTMSMSAPEPGPPTPGDVAPVSTPAVTTTPMATATVTGSTAPQPSTTTESTTDDGGGEDSGCSVSPRPRRSAQGVWAMLGLAVVGLALGRRRRN